MAFHYGCCSPITHEFMAETDTPRHKIIRRLVLQRPDALGGVSVSLWERLASELISITAQGGFHSLYSRSVHLAAATFPWIVTGRQLQTAGSRFSGLQASLEGKEFIEASEASITLLITFVDILATLIGESLTTSILRSAWGDSASDIDAKDL